MSVEALEIKVDPGSTQSIDALLAQLGVLESKLGNLGAGSSTAKLEQAMAQLAATVNTGFASMTQVLADSLDKTRNKIQQTNQSSVESTEDANAKIRASQEKTAEAISTSIAKLAEKRYMIEIQRVTQSMDADEKIRSAQVALGEAISADIAKRAEYEYGVTQKRVADAEKATQAQIALGEALSADIAKRAEYEYTITQKRIEAAQAAADKILATQVALGEAISADIAKRAEYEYTIEQKRIKDAEVEADKLVAVEDARLERQRVLNTNYLIANSQQQLEAALKAQTYASLGGNPTAKFGSMASSADVGVLQAQIAATNALKESQNALKPVLAATTAEQTIQNDVLVASQGLFRGAAHEAGVYGLVHGQILALLAGAGLAAALHQIAVAGADVEYNLKFLETFSSDHQPIDMDKFLGITSGTLSNVKQAAEGVRALAEAGFTTSQALTALPSLLQLSALGEMSVAQAAELAVESMHAFGKESTDLGNIGDVLVSVATKNNVSVKKLADDMRTAAVSGKLLGLTFEETAGSVAVLASKGQSIQPVVSALQALYEPSAKVQAVMDKLKLSFKDDGSFDGYMANLTKLRTVLAGYANENDAFKDLGISPRARAAIFTLTNDVEHLKTTIDEAGNAAGTMFRGVTSQEDTVEGVFKKLLSTVGVDFQKAFENAKPALMALELSLLDLAKSQSVVDFLTKLIESVTRLTQLFIDHGRGIAIAVAAYAGLAIISSIVSSVAAYAVAAEAAAVASVTMASGLTAAANGARVLMTTLGWVGIAVAAVSVAYELFHGSMTKDEAVRQTTLNSTNNNIDAYQRELERLKLLEAQLTATGEAGVKAAGVVSAAMLRMQIDNNNARISQLQQVYTPEIWTGRGGAQLTSDTLGLSTNKAQLAILNEINSLKKANLDLTTKESLAINIDKETKKVENIQQQKTLAEKVLGLTGQLEGIDKSRLDVLTAEVKNFQVEYAGSNDKLSLKQKELQIEKDILAAKHGHETVDTKSNSDIYNAAIQAATNEYIAVQKAGVAEIAKAKAEASRNEIDQITLAETVYSVAIKTTEAKVIEANKQIDLAQGQPNKRAAKEKYSGQVDVAEAAQVTALQALEDSKLKVIQSAESRRYVIEAKGLEDRHQYLAAQMLKDQHSYQAEEDQINSGISSMMVKISQGTMKYLDWQDLEAYFEKLKDIGDTKAANQQAAGWKDAAFVFDQAKSKFDDLANSLGKGMKDIVDQSAGLGLSAQWDAASTAETLYQKSIVDLTASLQKLKDAQASKNNDPKETDQLQIKVTDAQAKVQSFGDQMKKVWADSGAALTAELTAGFGNAGTALGGLLQSYQAYGTAQIQIDKNTAAARDAANGDQTKIEKINQDAASKTASLQIKTYVDMATAAQGFFAAGTKGYNALGAISKIYHAAEAAMTLAAWAKKTFFATEEVTQITTVNEIKQAMAAEGMMTDEVVTGKSVVQSGIRATADGTGALAKTANSVPFPYNLIAMAVVAAALSSAGVSVMGGGGGSSSSVPSGADNQKTAGTGSILGEPDTKSNSINDSITLLAANSNVSNKISSQMLNALTTIKDNIGALVNTLSVDSSGLPTAANTNSSSSFLGLWGSNTELTGQGLKFGGTSTVSAGTSVDDGIGGYRASVEYLTTTTMQTVNQIRAVGLSVQQFTDITTTSTGILSSLFGGGSSTSTQYAPASKKLQDEITGIILSSASVVSQGAVALGANKETTDATIGNMPFTVGNTLGKIDFTGMTNQQKADEVNSVLSAFSDSMAEQVLPAVKDFEHAGEGGLAAMMRLVTGTEAAQNSLDQLGIKMIKYTDIINKQGDVQVELERQSIMSAETTGGTGVTGAQVVAGVNGGPETMSSGVLSGIGQIVAAFTGTASDLNSLYVSLTGARAAMVSFGMGAADVTQAMLKGDGDFTTTASKFASDTATYFSKFTTTAQQTTAQGNALTLSLSAVGEVLPSNRQQFEALVTAAQSLHTEAGDKLYGALMSSASAADTYYTALEAGDKSFTDNMAALRGIQPDTTPLANFNTAMSDMTKRGTDTLPWITSFGQLLTMTKEDYDNLSPTQKAHVNDVLSAKKALDDYNTSLLQSTQSYTTAIDGYNNADATTQNIHGVSNALALLNDKATDLGLPLWNIGDELHLSAEQIQTFTDDGLMPFILALIGSEAKLKNAASGAGLDPWAQNQSNAQSGPTALDTLLAETKKFIEDLANIGETSYENAIRTIKDNAATRLDALNKAGTSVALTSEQQAIIMDANRLWSSGQITAQEYAAEMAKAQVATVSNTQAIDDWTQAQINLLNAQNAIKAKTITDPLNVAVQQVGMSQLAISIQNINKQASDYLKSLEDLGQTTAANTAQVEEWRKVMIGIAEAKGATDTMTTLLGQLDSLASMQKTIATNQQTIAIDGGADPTSFTKQNLADAQSAFDQINGDSSSTLQQKMAAANDLQAAIMANYNAQKTAITTNGAKQEQINQQAIQDFNAIQASLRKITDYSNSLLTSADSTLTPKQQLDVAAATYATTLAGAQGGDQKSLDKLQTDSQSYLDLARGYYASDENYVRIFTSVQTTLAALGATAKVDRVPADETATNTAAMAAALVPFATDATSQLSTIAGLTASWQTQIAAQMVAQAAVFASIGLNTAQTAAALQGLDGRIAALIATAMGQSTSTQDFGASQGKNVGLNKYMATVTGYTGAFVNGGFAAFMAAHPQYDMQAMIAQYNSIQSGTSVRDTPPPMAKGTNFLPKDMLIQAHYGERVMPAADNAMLLTRLQSPAQNSNAILDELKTTRIQNKELQEQLQKAIAQLAQITKKSAEANAHANEMIVTQQTGEIKKLRPSMASAAPRNRR